jgi:hypothetical protein
MLKNSDTVIIPGNHVRRKKGECLGCRIPELRVIDGVCIREGGCPCLSADDKYLAIGKHNTVVECSGVRHGT